MVKDSVKVLNATGLHARPASEFVKLANTFSSVITVSNLLTRESANAKSIMQILCMGLVKGTEIEIKAEGTDEEIALKALVDLVNTGFGEL